MHAKRHPLNTEVYFIVPFPGLQAKIIQDHERLQIERRGK
jgi:hypothetical protein